MQSRETEPEVEAVNPDEDLVEIRRAVGILFRPGDVVEVRVPKAGRYRTISGYFSGCGELVSAMTRLEENKWPGIYWTLNPVNPALAARANQKLKLYAEATTSDADILCRRWLPVDLDPRRPTGISSSDAEHQQALELAVQIAAALVAQGWPKPIFADSGNGAHLLYRVDLPNNPETTDLLKRCLSALSARYSTADVAVDETTFNASRIFKAYGTTSRKGDDTAERPHRASRIIQAPEEPAVVPCELLEGLAGEVPAEPACQARVYTMPPRRGAFGFDLQGFLEKHGIRFRAAQSYQGGRKLILEECPWDPTHRAPDAAVFESADGRLGFRCLHNSCRHLRWRDFRKLFEPDYGQTDREWVAEAAAQERESEIGGFYGAQVTVPWPAPIGIEGHYGLAGEFVRLVEPHTEADPNWLLILFLVYAGNVIGRNAFVWAGGDKHYTNLFAVGVGPTAAGRKGSAQGPVEMFFRGVDETWLRSNQSGLASGEGLIWAVRDPIYKRERVKKRGQEAEFQEVCVDEGVSDKRLLVKQSEFFGALQVMRREGNTLSVVLRDAWDRDFLASLTKNSPARSTNQHISIIGNITKEELLRGMLSNEADNGLANRFLWACSRRSKCLPEGGRMWTVDFAGLQSAFQRVCYHAENLQAVSRDGNAADLWGHNIMPDVGAYRELTKDQFGLYGAVVARGAAQVLRLSLIYALLDCAAEIRWEHLVAALEVWRYCEDSAKHIFGDALGDPTADEILRALRGSRAGLTRTEIGAIFDRNKSSTEIGRALNVLANAGLARFAREKTSGRPIERWFAVWKEVSPEGEGA
ncbi:MAG: helix-turn-helix transcriptional regulator [Bryobacterales bacterium]|nr:helix-turn-helix transcriptional regulator [Bryobacterales bacterium]